MSASYIDIKDYLQNIEENIYVEEYFSDEENANNQVLNDHDDIDVDWSEINLEESGSVSELSSMIEDEQEVEIEAVSIPNAAATPCVIIDTIQGEIRRCNGTAELNN